MLERVAAKRLQTIAQGFSPGSDKQISRPESGDRGACSARGVLIRLVVWTFAILGCTNTRVPAQRLGRHFQGGFGRELPRAKALGYGLQPLRGKT